MRPSFRLSAALAIVLATPLPALAQLNDAATVTHVREALRGAIAPQSGWGDVGPSAFVKAGDTLKTGSAAAAAIALPSGGTLTMGENTLVRLQDQSGLRPHVLTGAARLVAPAGQEVSLNAGAMTLSGTDGEAIVYRENGNWNVAVVSGAFKVGGGDVPPMTLEAGKLMSTGAGAGMATLSRSRLETLQAGFSFERVSGATSLPAMAVPGVTNQPNKWLATGLSAVLPGTGQLYAGEVPRGLTYLGLNFALLGVGLYARNNGQAMLSTAALASLVGLNVLSPLDAALFTPEAPAKK